MFSGADNQTTVESLESRELLRLGVLVLSQMLTMSARVVDQHMQRKP